MSIESLAKQYIYWPEVQNPYQKNIHFAHTPLSNIFQIIKTEINGSKSNIERAVFRFYTLNQALNEARKNEHNILNETTIELYRQYSEEIEVTSRKLFAYLVTICTMEARHVFDANVLESIRESIYEETHDDYAPFDRHQSLELNQTQEKQALRKYRETLRDFYPVKEKKLPFHIFAHVHQAISEFANRDDDKGMMMMTLMEKLQTICPEMNIESFLKSISLIFEYGEFENGYGGEAWMNITEHALAFTQGKINAEVFVDQAFSIEHNSGHIFNKEVIYTNPLAYQLTLVQPWKGQTYQDKVCFSQHQLVLNLQHHGILGAFLHTNFSDIKKSITPVLNGPYPVAFKQLFLDYLYPDNMPESVLEQMMNDTCHAIHDLCDLFSQIKQDIHTQNPQYPHYIQQFLPKQELDLYMCLDGMNLLDTEESDEVLELSEGHSIMCQAVPLFVNFVPQGHKKMKKFHFSSLDLKDVQPSLIQRELLGNKAYGIAHMMSLGLPVPQAVVLPTTNAQSFFNYPQTWLDALKAQSSAILNSVAPHGLFSVRSGAAVSMPGMMDTILNVGIDDTNYEILCKRMGEKVVNNCAIKFMDLFSQSVLGIDEPLSMKIHEACFEFANRLVAHGFKLKEYKVFPLNREEQLLHSVDGVFRSWFSNRAKTYRQIHQIDEAIGTAAIIQQMVFGNMNHNSCTGVVFSRDCITGKKGMVGEFLINAQGEDVVSGTVTPQNIDAFKNIFPDLYTQLQTICLQLERVDGYIQDIEFTVENGVLYILQKRKAVCTAQAQALITSEMIKEKILPASAFMDNLQVEALLPKVEVHTQNKPIGKGLIANPGVIHGVIVHNLDDIEYYRQEGVKMIYMASHTTPDDAPLMSKTDAFLTSTGGFTSHAAILARSWNKPCIVGAELKLKRGSRITLDANTGHIYEGFVMLKKASKGRINKLVELVLKEQGLNRININDEFKEDTTLLTEINSRKTWMEEQIVKKISFNKPQTTDKFFDLSHKIATMMIMHHHQQKKIIKGTL